MGNALLEVGRPDDAMKCFMDALEMDNELTAAHCYASEGYRWFGRSAKADEHRLIALQLDEEQAQQFLQLAEQQFARVRQRGGS